MCLPECPMNITVPTSSLSASSASSASASSSCRRMPGENRWEIHPFNQKIRRIPKNIIYKWLENHLQLVISGEFMWIQDLGLVFMYINYITEDILYRSLKLHGPQTHTQTHEIQLGTQSMTYPKPALILHTFEGSMIQDSEGTSIAGPTMFPDTLKAIPSYKRHANDHEGKGSCTWGMPFYS